MRTAIVAGSPESFTYDLDGNLLMNSLWTNTWSADNRVIRIESRDSVPDYAKRRVDFAYDHGGRMTTRQVASGYTGGAYAQTNETVFVWDGFNLLAEIRDETNQVFYTHGLDMSDSLNGGGGAGGLLFVADCAGSTTNRYCVANDGNENVVALIASDGSVAGEYLYGPFGEPLKARGEAARRNSLRWSTEYFDTATGLVMYDFRPYDPGLGRWWAQRVIGVAAGYRGGL